MALVERYRAAHPELDVGVHYVWLPMFPRAMERIALPRATGRVASAGIVQYWDEGKRIGRRLGPVALDLRLAGREDEVVKYSMELHDGAFVAWDAFVLFDADATWDTGEKHIVAWGSPIIEAKTALLDALDACVPTTPASEPTAASEPGTE